MGKRVPVGADVRIAGRVTEDGAGLRFTATDGGSIEVSGLMCGKEFFGQFVEIVGTKSGESVLNGIGAIPLGEQVDVELWDESVKLMNVPQLQEQFQPVAVTA